MEKELKSLDFNINKMFCKTVLKRKDNVFIKDVDLDVEITWNQAKEMVDKLSKGLIKLGIKKGDNVMVWLPNSYKWILLYLAVARLGAVGVMVNPANKEIEMDYLIKDSDCKYIIMSEGIKSSNHRQVIQNLIPNAFDTEENLINSIKYPKLKQIVFDYQLERLMRESDNIEDYILQKMCDDVKPTDPLNILYTSGTTGDPKGVVMNQRTIYYSLSSIVEDLEITEEDTLGSSLPLYHTFGLGGLILCPLLTGAKTVIMNGFNPSKFLKAIQDEDIRLSLGVPTMYIAMMNDKNIKNYDLKKHKKVLMGGAVCSPTLVDILSNNFNAEKIIVMYGLTEVQGIAHTKDSDPYEKRISSIGRKTKYFDIKIVDVDTKEDVGYNAVGEIIAKGPAIMDRYYKKEEETKKVMTEDGWFYTGDLATMDEDGYLYIVGRKKDIIKRGGEGIHPKEIENVLLTNEAIKDVQIIGVPDEKYGEEVMAYVILKDGYELSEDGAKEYVKSHLAIYKTPRYVNFVKAFPCTSTGKPQKFKLKEMAMEMLDA